jgi:dTMP kinase
MVNTPSNHPSPMFITFEGIEGSGKTTLLAAIDQHFRTATREVTTTREPGGTAVGDAIRALFLEPALRPEALTEALLVNASRAQLVAKVIEPALERGEVVLCDRFIHSTLAYQGYGRGIDLGLLRSLCDAATGRLVPAMVFLLDIPVAISRERIAARCLPADRLENESLAFHESVRSGFLELAAADASIRVLDATQPPAAVLAAALRSL